MKIILYTLLILISLLFILPILGDIFFDSSHPIYIFFKEIFESREALWVSITGLVTFTGILYALMSKNISDQKNFSNLKSRYNKGLKFELKRNFQTVFSGEVERVIDRNIYYKIRQNLDTVDDQDLFEKVVVLYKESELYERIVTDWRKDDTKTVTEKHSVLCHKYLSIIAGNLIGKELNGLSKSIEHANKATREKLESVDNNYKIFDAMKLTFDEPKYKAENEIYKLYREILIDLYSEWREKLEVQIDQIVDRVIEVK